MARWIDDISYRGDNDVFVWKWFREEDPSNIKGADEIADGFFSGSVLTVHESQECLFYLDGECIGVLGPGRHVLDTNTIPFLRRLLNFFTKQRNIFHAQIYFVNKVELPLKWGVGDIVYEDPAGPVFKVGANGEITLTVKNSRALVERLSGQDSSLTREFLMEIFRGIIASEVADTLMKTMLGNQISITNITTQMKDLSALVYPDIQKAFNAYGLDITQFRVLRIKVPEDDPQYKRLKDLRANQSLLDSELKLEQHAELLRQQMASEKTKMEADALAFKRRTEGYSYQQERQFDVMQRAAESDSSGMAGDIVKLGVGLGTVGVVGKLMDAAIPAMQTAAEDQPSAIEGILTCTSCNCMLSDPSAKFCPNCGKALPKHVFCSNCGSKVEVESRFCVQCGNKL